MPSSVNDKIETFFSAYRSRHYAKGQILILNGDTSDVIYQVIGGRVKCYDVSYRGDEIILNMFKPPAFFPMSLALTEGASHYIYAADTDIVIRQAPAKDVLRFLEQNPDVLLDLLKRVYIGVEGILGRLGFLMSGSAQSRLTYELVLEARRFGEKDSDQRSRLLLSEKDLGARTGLSRETVSRELQKLKARGLIKTQAKEIIIPDIAALAESIGVEV